MESGEDDTVLTAAEAGRISSLTRSQQIALALLPIVPSLLSLGASLMLAFLVHCTGYNTTYRRILFGFAIFDAIGSITSILSPLLLPRETSSRVWALGTAQWCNATAGLTQLSFALFWYYCVMSFYFLFVVKYGMKDATMKKWEIAFHILAIGYNLVTCILGFVFDLYDENELGRGCWVVSYDPDFSVAAEAGWVFGGIPGFVSLILILVNNILIFHHVKSTTLRFSRRLQNHSTGRCCGSGVYNRIRGQAKSSTPHRRQRLDFNDPNTKRVKEVAIQAFLYVAICVGTYWPFFVLRILENSYYVAADEDQFYPLLVCAAVLPQMIGVLNLGVYIRPRYLQTRQEFKESTRFWALRRALYGEAIQPADKKCQHTTTTFNMTDYRASITRSGRHPQPIPVLETGHMGEEEEEKVEDDDVSG